MRKGTFSVQKANSNSSAHNSRENPPRYLIGLEDGEENYYELIKSDSDFILEAKRIYKKTTGQDMQKSYTISKGKRKGTFVSAQEDNLIQETVLTLKKSQNENDVKELFKKLNKKYGGHEILEVSVHRDEGHFSKDGIAYYPTKNILKKDDEYYICSDYDIEKPKEKDFNTKVNINEFEKVYNYHAHVKFSMFDRYLGKSATMQKKDMSSRIKFVSDELGLAYDPKNRSRTTKSVNQIKDEHLAKARGQEKVRAVAIAKVKDLNTEIEKLRKELINSKSASKEDYQVLRETKEQLKVEIKAKNLTTNQLQHNIQELREELISTKKENKHLKSAVELKDIEIIELRETIEATNVSNENEKRSYTQSIEQLNSENITLEQEIEQFQEKLNIQAKKIIQLEEEKKDLVSSNELKERKLSSALWENENITQSRDVIYEQFEELQEKDLELKATNNYLEKENKDLKATKSKLNKSFVSVIEKFVEVLNIPKALNFLFFDSAVEKINSILKENKTLQEQNKALNDKVIELEKKNDSRPNISYSEDVILVEDFSKNAVPMEKVTFENLNEIEKELVKEHERNLKDELFKEPSSEDREKAMKELLGDENERGLEL